MAENAYMKVYASKDIRNYFKELAYLRGESRSGLILNFAVAHVRNLDAQGTLLTGTKLPDAGTDDDPTPK